MNHLLMHCLVARDIWDMVFALFGVQLVMPKGFRIDSFLVGMIWPIWETETFQYGRLFHIV